MKALVHKSCRDSGDFTPFIKLLRVCGVCEHECVCHGTLGLSGDFLELAVSFRCRIS